MAKSLFLLLVMISIAFMAWWWWPSAAEKPALDTISNSTQEKREQTDSKTSKKETDSSAVSVFEQENPYQDAVIEAQIQQIADQYEQNSRYPITSQPIQNPEDVRDFEPFEEAEVDLPFPDEDEDGEPIRIVAATDRFQYFNGDLIQARVQIVNGPSDTFQSVSGVLAGDQGDLPNPINFEPSTAQANTFLASFDTRIAPAELMSQEMLLKLEVTIGGRKLFTTVALRYAQPSAHISGLGLSQPLGAELVIPAQLSVFQPGYYFLSAVLEDAATGQPLIQLQNEARLNAGNAELPLKAHISALRAAGSEGPYRLRQLQILRGAEAGETSDKPGSVFQSQFDVPGFAFSAYRDEEFSDPQAQERLEFLREIGNAETESDQ